jgi:hypothetical protein
MPQETPGGQPQGDAVKTFALLVEAVDQERRADVIRLTRRMYKLGWFVRPRPIGGGRSQDDSDDDPGGPPAELPPIQPQLPGPVGTLFRRGIAIGKLISSNAKTPGPSLPSVFADRIVGGKARLPAASPWTRTLSGKATTPHGF